MLGILGAEMAIEASGGSSVTGLVLRRLFLGFAIGAVVAFVVGLFWSRLLRGLKAAEGHGYGEVLAFGAVEAGLPGAEAFPLYAFFLLVVTNLLMVFGLRGARPPGAGP